MSNEATLPESQAIHFAELIAYTDKGIASRVVTKTSGGNVTLFAFDEGQGLSEHTAPFDALVTVLEGNLELTIGGKPVVATVGSITRMPANVPHALEAKTRTRMLLVMLRDPKPS